MGAWSDRFGRWGADPARGPGQRLSQRLAGRFSRGTAAGLMALTGLAVLTVGPAGLALGMTGNSQESADEAARYLPGMEVRDGPATFVVHELRCGEDDDARHGRRCLATVGARNDGTEPLTIPGSGQLLHSPEGVRHLPVGGGSAPFGTLAPGEHATAEIAYDVPEQVPLTHLEVRGDAYSHGRAVALPGLPLPLLPD